MRQYRFPVMRMPSTLLSLRCVSSCGSGGCGGPGNRIDDFAKILSQAKNRSGDSGNIGGPSSPSFFDGNFAGGNPMMDPSMLQGMQQTLRDSLTPEVRDSMRAMMEGLQRGDGLPQMGMMAFGLGENEKGKKVARGAKVTFDPNTGRFAKDFVEKQLEEDDPMLPKETVENYSTEGAMEVEFENSNDEPRKAPEKISEMEVEFEEPPSPRTGKK